MQSIKVRITERQQRTREAGFGPSAAFNVTGLAKRYQKIRM